MSEGWYYADAGSSVGPVALDELQKALRARRDAPRILVWRHGFQDWAEAGSVPELVTAVTGPPLRSRQRPPLPGKHLTRLDRLRYRLSTGKPCKLRTSNAVGRAQLGWSVSGCLA